MSAQTHESRAQGLMALLAKGLVESSAKRTASSLGDRSQYVGMSDIGRALECPRAAVGNKLFGNSADHEGGQHDLATLHDKLPAGKCIEEINHHVVKKDRRFRALDPTGKDLELLQAISDPAYRIAGLTIVDPSFETVV